VSDLKRLAALMGLLLGFSLAALAALLTISAVYGVALDKLAQFLPFAVAIPGLVLPIYQVMGRGKAHE
jgi:hypothetical protein